MILTSRVIEIFGRFQLLCQVHCWLSSNRKFLSISICRFICGSSSYSGVKFDKDYKSLEGIGEGDFGVQIEKERGQVLLVTVGLVLPLLVFLLVGTACCLVVKKVETLQE